MYPRSGFRSGRASAKTTLLKTTLFQKILAPIKIKSALPPPPKPKIPPPPKRRNFMDMAFSCRTDAFFQASIKLAQPFPAPKFKDFSDFCQPQRDPRKPRQLKPQGEPWQSKAFSTIQRAVRSPRGRGPCDQRSLANGPQNGFAPEIPCDTRVCVENSIANGDARFLLALFSALVRGGDLNNSGCARAPVAVVLVLREVPVKSPSSYIGFNKELPRRKKEKMNDRNRCAHDPNY